MSLIRSCARWTIAFAVIFDFSFFATASARSEKGAAVKPVLLRQVLAELARTHPEVLEALERYRSVTAERSVAVAGYWPQVGTEIDAGQELTDGLDTDHRQENLTAATATLYAKQNLFDGGRTRAFVDETDARIMAAAHEVLNVVNRVFLDGAEAYVHVLKARKLLAFAKENVLIQEKILIQVEEKTAAGFNRVSDLNSAKARMALARGNLISKQQDLIQAVAQFHRQFGRLLKPEQFVEPRPVHRFPETVEGTVALALDRHPALKVADYNILVRKHSYEKARAEDWPTLGLELKAQHRDNTNGDRGETDHASAMLKFHYTFFDGGTRRGKQEKFLGEMKKEYQRSYTERRNVVQSTRLAWNIWTAEKQKKKFLADHLALSAQTLDDFKEEYFVGRRNLLDLLNMENEYNAAENADAESKFSHLLAYFRISQATGLLLSQYDTGLREMLGLSSEVPVDLDAYAALDRDRDRDAVDDLKDQCDNTAASGRAVLPSGCARSDTVSLGYETPGDLKPYIRPDEEGGRLLPFGQELKEDFPSGTVDGPDIDLDDRLTFDIDPGEDVQSIVVDSIIFESDSTEPAVGAFSTLTFIAEHLKTAEEFMIEIIGHTDSTASAGHNRRLSLARALRIQDELARLGIEKSRMLPVGMGESQPIAANDTEEGKRKNRRIEFRLTRKSDEAISGPPGDTGQGPFLLPEKGTPEALNLNIDPRLLTQSIHLDLIHFASDSAAITEDIRIVLRHIAPQLKAAHGFTIEVIGHTDDTAGVVHNLVLSRKRARNVADELLVMGLDPEVLTVSGRGEFEPRETNRTEEGKRKNRRIEFKLTRKPAE